MDSSYKQTQIASSSLPRVRLKTDASSGCWVKDHICVAEAGTDALGQLSAGLLGAGITKVCCGALVLLCFVIGWDPLSLHL